MKEVVLKQNAGIEMLKKVKAVELNEISMFLN